MIYTSQDINKISKQKPNCEGEEAKIFFDNGFAIRIEKAKLSNELIKAGLNSKSQFLDNALFHQIYPNNSLNPVQWMINDDECAVTISHQLEFDMYHKTYVEHNRNLFINHVGEYCNCNICLEQVNRTENGIYKSQNDVFENQGLLLTDHSEANWATYDNHPEYIEKVWYFDCNKTDLINKISDKGRQQNAKEIFEMMHNLNTITSINLVFTV